VPVFGSAAWCALADEDPAKAFAAARAAMAWWSEQERAARQRADDHVQASHAIAGAADWAVISREPSHQELTRRRVNAAPVALPRPPRGETTERSCAPDAQAG